MDSALAALITSAAGTGAPTNPSSRYYGSAVEQFTLAERHAGHVPGAADHPAGLDLPTTQTYVIADGDRLDNLAARFLGDPLLYWMICDANGAHRPRRADRPGRAPDPDPGARRRPARSAQWIARCISTLLAGPVEAVPGPQAADRRVRLGRGDRVGHRRSGFQLTFTLADDSILQTFLLLTASSPIPLLRVVLLVTFGGLPQVIIDGVIEHHEVTPDAMHGLLEARSSAAATCRR